jgi:hypothetical protein
MKAVYKKAPFKDGTLKGSFRVNSRITVTLNRRNCQDKMQ